MANTSRPWGFRPVYTLQANVWNGATTLYAFSASDGTAAFKGDTYKIDSTYDTTSLTDVLAPVIPFITVTGGTITTTVFRGAIVGFVPQPEYNMIATASLGTMYRLASTARYAWCVQDPFVVYEAEESGTNSYVSATNNPVNKLLDITAGSGSTTTGVSGYTLTGAAGGATTDKPFRVLRATQRIDNFASAASDTSPYWHWDVMNDNSDLTTNKVGV